MCSAVVKTLDKFGVLLKVAANPDQRLRPVAASAISARLDTFGERRRTSYSQASNGGGDEGKGELHVGKSNKAGCLRLRAEEVKQRK